MHPVISIENLSKSYSLGQIGTGTLSHDINVWWAKARGKPNPMLKIGEKDHSNRDGEIIWALKDVNFTVEQGEVLGIIGRNGAGKSTLLKILSRVTAPTSGHVRVKGRIASLLEVGTGFHPDLTGRENIYLNGAILGMTRKEIRSKLDEIVAFAEIEQFIDTPVKRYSSGMYVRLAFAVAAHLEPEILVVDEVLAVGDTEFQKKCLGKMGDVAKQGRTVLFVSHNMLAIQALCNRVIMLSAGLIGEDGPSSQVIMSYLDPKHEIKAEKHWSDPNISPGNELFRLANICVRDEFGIKASKIGSDSQFIIEIEYWNLRPNTISGSTIVLYNQEGICVLSSINNHDPKWHNQSKPAGLFRSTCQIPSSFLNEGRYSITVLIFGENYSSVYKEDECIEFEIYDTGGVRGDYFGGWSGIVRPLLQWHTEQIIINKLNEKDEQ